uniref:Uncharacterized protein n=1 Tax=Ixodes ricinus TaxID=34613 RepID=A0A0K8RCC5_IXORI
MSLQKHQTKIKKQTKNTRLVLRVVSVCPLPVIYLIQDNCCSVHQYNNKQNCNFSQSQPIYVQQLLHKGSGPVLEHNSAEPDFVKCRARRSISRKQNARSMLHAKSCNTLGTLN